MSFRQQEILDAFKSYGGIYGLTTFGLSVNLGIPEASIRRDIQSLRKLGHNISFASPNGVYRLGK